MVSLSVIMKSDCVWFPLSLCVEFNVALRGGGGSTCLRCVFLFFYHGGGGVPLVWGVYFCFSTMGMGAPLLWSRPARRSANQSVVTSIYWWLLFPFAIEYISICCLSGIMSFLSGNWVDVEVLAGLQFLQFHGCFVLDTSHFICGWILHVWSFINMQPPSVWFMKGQSVLFL